MDDMTERLARNLFAAYVAWKMGVTLRTGKKYAMETETLSPWWMDLANCVEEYHLRVMEEMHRRLNPPPATGRIQ